MLINPKRSIFYLTGFMGSGKSTIGRELAERLGLKFYDLDILIEERAKKSIAQIFEEDGASIFRAIEAEVLKDISKLSYCVVALGGGTIMDFENLILTQQTGFLICLSASTEETWNRVSETERRILLEGKRLRNTDKVTSNDIAQRIEQLKQIREPFYDESDIFIDTTNLTVDEVVSEIIAKLDIALLDNKL
jgi:shikimate kinase